MFWFACCVTGRELSKCVIDNAAVKCETHSALTGSINIEGSRTLKQKRAQILFSIFDLLINTSFRHFQVMWRTAKLLYRYFFCVESIFDHNCLSIPLCNRNVFGTVRVCIAKLDLLQQALVPIMISVHEVLVAQTQFLVVNKVTQDFLTVSQFYYFKISCQHERFF